MRFRFWMFLPADWAHSLAPFCLNLLRRCLLEKKPDWDEFKWRNLVFPNRVGVAGGVDKNGLNLAAWRDFGYGFAELGTVTPLPQSPNPGQTMARDWKRGVVWNKMGFPNDGAERILTRLSRFNERAKAFKRERSFPVFVNIGKNRTTLLENAQSDYLSLIELFAAQTEVFVVNISSPNTEGLRKLFEPEHLKNFLKPLVARSHELSCAILIKVSPDLNSDEVDHLISVSCDLNLDGWVLTNTTTERERDLNFPEGGGLSGEQLRLKSRYFLSEFMRKLGARKGDRLVVSVGGILDTEEMRIRRALGADLVEVYSALIFYGPTFVKFLRHRLWP